MTRTRHLDALQWLDNVKRLFVAWQSVPPASVNLNEWRCGSYACLLGHAASMPEFVAQGLRFESKVDSPRVRPVVTIAGRQYVGTEAGYAIFGSPTMFCGRGFAPADEELGVIPDRYAGENESATAIDDWHVADHRLRHHLKANGVDPDAVLAAAGVEAAHV